MIIILSFYQFCYHIINIYSNKRSLFVILQSHITTIIFELFLSHKASPFFPTYYVSQHQKFTVLSILIALSMVSLLGLLFASFIKEKDEACILFNIVQRVYYFSICNDEKKMDRKKWSCIVYRRAQKELAHLFLQEAEHLLNLCLQGQL